MIQSTRHAVSYQVSLRLFQKVFSLRFLLWYLMYNYRLVCIE